MEFYKMFSKRADWINLYRWQRYIMLPEWYVESERIRLRYLSNRFFEAASTKH